MTDLLVDPDSPDAALGFLHALRRQPGWDLLECRAVVAGGSLARAATTIGATVRPDVPAFAIPLDPATPMLSSGRNRELRRLNRRMAETAGVEIKVYGTEDGEWPGALDALMTYHRRRWTNTVTPSPFEDAQLRSRFAAWFATPPDGVRPLVAVLREIGSRRIRGVVLGFEGRDETHAWRIAYDPALRPYSPGIQLLTALARNAQVRGHGFLELGRGADAYKRTWHTIQRDRVTVRWHRNTPLYRAIDLSRRYLGRGPYSKRDSR